MANRLAVKRNTKVFVSIEATAGTPIKPVTGDTVMLWGPGTVSQPREIIPDEQIRSARSRLSPIAGRYEAGTWNFPTAIKPSGTLGTAPEAGNLWQAAFGTHTNTPVTSDVYTLANDIDSFTLWFLKDHTLYACAGATVGSLEIAIPGGGVGMSTWNGGFVRQLYAGTDELDGAQDGSSVALTDITVADARKYYLASLSGGIYIEIGTDDNSGHGFEVTAVNYTTNVLTISPGLGTAQLDEAVVAPWLPDQTEVGTPLHGKPGVATLDEGSGAADFYITSFNCTINNNVKYVDDEKTGTLFPATHITPTFREVTGSLEIMYRQNDVKFDRFALNRDQGALIVPCGDVAGSIIQVSIPYMEVRTPSDAGDEEIRRTMEFDAVASAALNDEIAVTFV